MGGRHQPHVHPDRPRAAQALELLLLQHAEQLGLQLRWDVTDFIEEQRPPVRQLEAAYPLADGAGEGALLVAEQLALQQPGGDGGAVDLDEGPLAADAEVVQRTGDELLARAGLASDEDGGVGGGDNLDLLEGAAQGGALADDLAEVVLGADLLLQVGLLLGKPVPERLDLLEGEGVFDGQGDLIGDELEEAHVGRIVGGQLLGHEDQRPEPPPGRGQRKLAAAPASIRPHLFHEPRPAPLRGQVRQDQRLLRLPHQPLRRFSDGKLHPGARGGFGGLQDVQPHGVARRLVQNEAEIVEAHHLVKPAGQLVEQRRQVAVRDDRFRDGQQGSVRVVTRSRLPI